MAVLYVYYPPTNGDRFLGVPNRHITDEDWASFSWAQRHAVEEARTKSGLTTRNVWVHRDLVDETEEERAEREEQERLAREAYDRANSLVRYGQIETMIGQLEVLPPVEEFQALRDDVDAVAEVPAQVAAVEGTVAVVAPKADRADNRVFDVRRYGADPANTALQNALAFDHVADLILAENGGTMLIPDGTFQTSEDIPQHSGMTIQGMGRRRSRIHFTDPNKPGVSIVGSTASTTKVQASIRDIAIVGPGKAVAGSGSGIFTHWASFGLDFERVYIAQWPGHGAEILDTYSMKWDGVQFDNNKGDGFFGETNINHTTFLNTIAINNGGRGYYINGGAASVFINADAESNQGAAIDLRYATKCLVFGCELERNGGDGASPSIYLHFRSGLGEKCNATSIISNLIQGQSITPWGVIVDGANECIIDDNWFSNHLTGEIQLTANASRTRIGTNVRSGGGGVMRIVDSSATTGRFGYDYTNLMYEVSPGQRFVPRATNPPALAEGMVWAATGGLMRTRDDARIRRFITVIEGSATIDAPSIPAHSTTEITLTLAGAAAGDGVLVIPPATTSGLIAGQARVSAADTISIPVANVSGAAIDAPSAGWKVKVYKG